MSSRSVFPALVWTGLVVLSALTVAAQNGVLRELAKEDQDYQLGKPVARTNEDRIKLVLGELGQGKVVTPEDKANAAIVLQHTGLTLCDGQYVSISPDNYLLAHRLAKSAYEAGYKKARYLVAQTIDRYLSFTEGYQKYGTNILTDQETGKDEYVPIDRNTTDRERAEYGVQPLIELLKRFPERSRKKKP